MANLAPGRHPWQAAFVAFCNGAPDDEISQIFNIPPDALNNRIHAENWAALRAKLPLACGTAQGGTPELPAKINAKLELIEQNRRENLAVFADLRDHLVETIRALKARTLKLEKQYHHKGSIVRAEVEPGPSDWLNIATYARTIADGTYRALGDFQAQEKPGSDAVAGAPAPSGPAITIILPGAVAAPRPDRKIDEQVIDLTEVKDK
jgi:hypothetical protein